MARARLRSVRVLAALALLALSACSAQTAKDPAAAPAEPALPLDPSEPVGTSTTTCVDGKPVSSGSSIEGGGTAPALPESVVHATPPVPALSGGTLLALADGTTLAASDPERDRIYLIDTTRETLAASVELLPRDEPGRLVQDAAGLIHVVLRRAGAIATLDPKRGGAYARRSVCAAPRGIAYEPVADELFVACAGGELVTLPAASGAAIRSLVLESDLRDVVLGPGGALWLSTFRRAEVLRLGQGGLVEQRLQPGSGAVSTIFGPRQHTPSVAWRMLSMPGQLDSVVLLHQTGVTDTVDVAPGGYASVNGCGAVVQAAVSVLGSTRPSPPVASGLEALSLVIDAAVSPRGEKLALAVAGNGAAQGPGVVETPLAGLGSPHPPCSAVENDLARQPRGQVVAVAYSQAGELFAQTREPATLWRASTDHAILLASESRADTGHFLFHANSGGGLTCASCHPEGGEDGRAWNLACAGPRRTQSLRGGIGATAPFHWDGSELDFDALIDDVFTGRMAGPLLSSEQKAALSAWVDTVESLPNSTTTEPATLARGRALFEDPQVGCGGCHSGALFTNNATVDVGTGRAFQVPSLRGLAFRAPFMHDGCAKTLSDRFAPGACGGSAHGTHLSLSAADLDALVAYVASL